MLMGKEQLGLPLCNFELQDHKRTLEGRHGSVVAGEVDKSWRSVLMSSGNCIGGVACVSG